MIKSLIKLSNQHLSKSQMQKINVRKFLSNQTTERPNTIK